MARKTTRAEQPNPICDLNAIERLAFASAKDVSLSKDERDALKPGPYPVDCLVHLQGTVDIGKDCETRQVNKLDPFFLLQVALNKLNGVTIEAIIKESQELWDRNPQAEEFTKQFSDRAKEAMAALKEKTKCTRKGAVKFDGIVTRYHPDGSTVSVQVWEGNGQPTPG